VVYAKNATPSRNLVVSMPMVSSNATVWLFDITGADTTSPVAQTVASGPDNVSGSFKDEPKITPANAGSLLIVACGIGHGPITSLDSPAGGRFMSVGYTDETDYDTFNNADGYAIEYVGADKSARNFSWTNSLQNSEEVVCTGTEVKPAQ
jgi:hypothetical protein